MRNALARYTLVALLIATACIASAGDEVDLLGLSGGDDVIFLVQRVEPTVVMEALFEGRVVPDSAGCLRLAGPDPATVVWPYGARLDGLTVRDAAGRTIGRIGGPFRLGGGEVPALHTGIPLSAAEREAARRCPGRFWIVGDVPR